MNAQELIDTISSEDRNESYMKMFYPIQYSQMKADKNITKILKDLNLNGGNKNGRRKNKQLA